jgi:rhamnosyltransferase
MDLKLLHTGRVHRLSSKSNGRLVSIIIPVKNGAADLRISLPRVLAQICAFDVEIIAVDSGSADDSVEVLRSFDATVLSVDPSLFDYGLTRNAAAAHASGEYLVFLTVRALPADRYWLTNLLDSLDEDPKVAGVYSRSLPRLDLDLLGYRDELRYLRPPLEQNTREIRDWSEYRSMPPEKLGALIAFRNVSCIIRREVFTRIPFRSAIFGEDMVWAREALEAGFKIRYQPFSVVFHSHNYTYFQRFQRSFDDGVGCLGASELRLLEGSAVLPTVWSMVLNDWHYLENWFGFDRESLDYYRIDSLLRRSALVVGQFLGANHDRIYGDLSQMLSQAGEQMRTGNDEGETAQYWNLFQRAIEDGAADYARSGVRFDQEVIFPTIISSIHEEWRALEEDKQLHPVELERSRLHRALRVIARVVGTWLGANQDVLSSDLKTMFSLIGQIRIGVVSAEMGQVANERHSAAALIELPFLSPFRVDSITDPMTDGCSAPSLNWHADVIGLQTALYAYEAEYSALMIELDMRAQVMADLQSKAIEKDRIIRKLEAEVSPVDALIRFGRELWAKVRRM